MNLERSILESIDKALPKMTDLGLSLSQVIHSQVQESSSSSDADEEYLESALQMGRKKKTGIRGRPKGTDHGFGKSTTHKMSPTAAKLMGTANLAFVSMNYQEAIELLLQVIKVSPNSFEPYHTLGLIWEEQGDLSKAQGFFMLSGLLNPSDRDTWMKLADWACRDGDKELTSTNSVLKREEAVFCLNKAIQATLDVLEAEELFWKRARLHLTMGNAKEAVKSFTRLLIKSPDNVLLIKRVAKMAIAQKIPLIAADVLEKVGIYSTQWSVLNILLELLFMADVDHSRVCRLVEEYCTRLADQSSILSIPEWGTWSGDERMCKLLQQCPVEIYAKYCISCCHCQKSVSALDRLISDTEWDAFGEMRRLLAEACYQAGDYHSSLLLLQSLLNYQNTWSVAVCCKVGHCFARLNHVSEALNMYQACLDADPGYEEARVAMARLFQERGDGERLLETLEIGRRFKQQRNKRVMESDEDYVYEDASEDDKLDKGSEGSEEEFPDGKKRVEFTDLECDQVKQEFQRIKMSLEFKERRELYQEALSSAWKLIQAGLLNNPNAFTPRSSVDKKHKKKRRFASPFDCRALMGLTGDEWIELTIRYCTGLEDLENAARLLETLCSHNSVLSTCGKTINLRVALAEIAKEANLYALLLDSLRPFLKERPSDPKIWHWITQLLPPGTQGRTILLSSTPFSRFINRLTTSTKHNDFLYALQGNLYGMSASWEEALRAYEKIRECSMHSALLLGNAHYHRAQQRTCTGVDKKWHFLSALALLTSFTHSAARYNVGRMYHGVGFLEGALSNYTEVIESDAEIGLQRLAAFNVMLVYQQTSFSLAKIHAKRHLSF